jgi:type I restriction enzyme S subunit
MATSQDFANWVCGEDLDAEFLMYALICSRTHLRSLATGATHKTIYMPTLEAFHICMPDLPEQKAIAHVLNLQLASANRAHEAALAQLKDIERLPGRILSKAFGGKKSEHA